MIEKRDENKKINSTFFKDKLKPLFTYVGTIGAAIMVVCYVITVMILVFGFRVQVDHLKQSIIFAVVNGVVGFIIMQFLKIQGVDFAKGEHKELIDKYNKIVMKEDMSKKNTKPKSLTYYWITSTIKDFIMKALTIIIASCGMIYIVIEGSNDYSLILLAVVNLLMFTCFGLLSLVGSYDFYSVNHVNYMEYKIKTVQNTENSEAEKGEQLFNDKL